MSTQHIEDALLQRYLDDDLEEQERAALEKDLGDDARLHERGRVLAMQRLSSFVQSAADDYAAELTPADSEALFAGVLAGIASQTDSAQGSAQDQAPTQATGKQAAQSAGVGAEDGVKRPKLRLIAGEGLGTLPPHSEKVAFEPKLGPDAVPPESGGADSRSGGADAPGSKWPGVLAVVGLAAAAALAIFARPEPSATERPVAEVIAPITVPEADPAVEVDHHPEVIVAVQRGSEVEEVDFGSNIGTVFQVRGEHDVPVAVVWLSDEEYVR